MTTIHVLRLLALLLDPRPLCSYDYRILERDGSFYQIFLAGREGIKAGVAFKQVPALPAEGCAEK